MSGHSKWSTIKRQKGAKDSTRGAMFTKIGNAIAVAARNGTDPQANFALRLAIDKAKAVNMPSANIQKSIDRVKEKDASQLIEVLYEGYGPGGVGILVESATDNINRTYPDVKTAFSRHGGSIAEKGAVIFQFNHVGIIRINNISDDLTLAALENEAIDASEEDDQTIIYTQYKDLAKVKNALSDLGFEAVEAELTYEPKNVIELNDKETAAKVIRLMEALDNIPDVIETYVNFNIADELI